MSGLTERLPMETEVVRTCEMALYLDQAAGRLALASIRETAGVRVKPARLPVRVYPCDVCDGWHVTAKPVQGRKLPWDRDPHGFDRGAPRIFSNASLKSSQGHAGKGSDHAAGRDIETLRPSISAHVVA